MELVRPVLLSGGAGKRLWPLSTRDCPKPLLALFGDESLLAQTVARVSGDPLFDSPVVVCESGTSEAIRRNLEATGAPFTLIVEPEGRNTAPAIALAALMSGPEDILLVMPCDHKIADDDAFKASVRSALELAQAGQIVTFGITPARATSAYGYIERGEAWRDGVFKVQSFVEKPPLAEAERYCAGGGHYWNAGIFLFRADVILRELEKFAPDVLVAVSAARDAARDVAGVTRAGDAFLAAPSISIDRAVMEHSSDIVLVPADWGWSDLGTFESVYDEAPHDEAGNSCSGEVTVEDASGCLVRSSGPKVVVVGVSDLVVVATPDGVLVAPRGSSARAAEMGAKADSE